jgi:hypothetical protein
MAYKQSPGRQMMPKTGRGLSPALMCGSPVQQEKKKDPYTGKTRKELGGLINDWSEKNSQRVASEMVAKSDSSNVAKAALILGDSKKTAARKGNEAANKTRVNKNIPVVDRGRSVNSGGVLNDPKNPDTYSRRGQLEKDLPGNLTNAWLRS